MQNQKVDEYLAKQPSPQKEICQALRELIFANFHDIKEEFKLGVPYYEEKFYIVSLKGHVNIGFALDKLSKEQISQLKGGGKTTKHFQISSLEEIDKNKISAMLQAAY